MGYIAYLITAYLPLLAKDASLLQLPQRELPRLYSYCCSELREDAFGCTAGAGSACVIGTFAAHTAQRAYGEHENDPMRPETGLSFTRDEEDRSQAYRGLRWALC